MTQCQESDKVTHNTINSSYGQNDNHEYLSRLRIYSSEQ